MALGYCHCLHLSVRPSVTKFVLAITHYPFQLGSPNLDHRCKRPLLRSLFFGGLIDFQIKFYPSLNLWVCPCHKSPRIVVRISKFGPKMHLSTVKVPDWFWDWLRFIFSFSFKPVIFYQTLHLLFTCIGLYIFSETIASECSTFHMALHIYGFSCTRTGSSHGLWHSLVLYLGGKWMSRQLGDWHWISQAPIGFRQIIPTSHAAISYANNLQSQQ